ncbi:MAG: TonB-dependent receptor [Pelobium sp.]
MTLGVSFAQTKQVTGKVTDATTNETLIGVSVSVVGTKSGTQTDENGNYSISVPNSETLSFTYLGYKPKQIKVAADQRTINVSLESDAQLLNEVVAIGYGTVRKKDLTGSVSSVSADVIAAAPVSSALEAIQGRVAGVQISSTDGAPGADISVRVRGGGSITGDNTPLYIVDGFPVSTISDISPNDIESIDILKDASSAAIYGSRGANGVILVTTKSGKSGKTSVSFNVFGGINNIANQLDVLTPSDYVSWQYERSLLANTPLDYTRYFGNYQDMDLYANQTPNNWQDIVFGRSGNTYNQNLSVSGGSEKTKYSLSHNFVNNKAIMLGSDYQRQNLNFKLNQKLYDNLSLDVGLRYSDTKVNGAGANEQNEVSSADSRLKYALLYPPFPVQGLTTTTETDDAFNLYNPKIAISDNDQYIRRKTYNLNAALTYEVIPNLKLKSEFGYDVDQQNRDRFYGTTTYYVRNVPTALNQNLPAVIFEDRGRNKIRNTNTLNYNFKKFLSKDHTLNLLAGQEYIKGDEQTLGTTVHGFPASFSFDNTRKLSTQGQANSIDNNFSVDDILLSFFGRANYDFKGKYLLSATFRADGSSKFSPGNRWGYFPSVSGAWRVSEESFLKNTKEWLADLKLRASYGASGNNNIPSGQIAQSFQNSTTTFVNGANSFWAPSKTQANPDLKWESNITKNIGLDFSLFNTKINGTIDAYLNTTKDLLIQYPVAGTGYDFQYRNLGETQNKGLEFSLNWNAVRKTNFDLTVNGNISFNRNKVNSLGGIQNILGSSGWASSEIGQDYLIQEGASIGRMYGYQSAGRYEVSDFSGYNATTSTWTLNSGVANATSVIGTIRPGSMKLIDTNNDGKVDLSDRTIIGNANPLNTGGFSLNARVFNFDLGTYFNWSYGNDIYNANKIEYTSTSKYSSRNMISEMETGKRWNNLRSDGTISNDPAELTTMNATTSLWSPYMKSFVFSDYAVEDGSFLRLGTVTLGYTFPQSISKKLKMQKLRIYASGYNLLTVTDYSGFDPEVSTRRKTNLTPGVDYSAYPRSKSYIIGLNVNF